MNTAKIGLAIQGGLSVVCATCSLYWRAREAGMPEPACLAKNGCGSPLRGGDFHEYDGPITDFGRWCFVCGEEASHGVRVSGRIRSVGMCGQHLSYLTELRSVDAPDVAVQSEILGSNTTIGVERLLKPRKKTLGQEIYEVESYYAKKNGIV